MAQGCVSMYRDDMTGTAFCTTLPANSRAVRGRRAWCACARPPLPRTYDALYTRAAEAVSAAVLHDGLRAVEVEFPATANLSRAGDGSARSIQEARESNALLTTRVARKLVESSEDDICICMVTFNKQDFQMIQALPNPKGIPCFIATIPNTNIGIKSIQDNISHHCNSDKHLVILIAMTPAGDEEWNTLERLVTKNIHKDFAIVVANGLFRNGLDWLTPVFYAKPCSGWGTLLLEYPRPYEVYSARTGKVLQDIQVDVLTQGRIRRPNLTLVANILQRDYYAR